jgi:hypothetical protein
MSLLKVLRTGNSYYAQIFGFEPADDVEPVEIVGL